jgi:acetone carboxylase gamma subunit
MESNIVKTQISNLVRMSRFWNNIHHVLSVSKDCETNYVMSLRANKPKSTSHWVDTSVGGLLVRQGVILSVVNFANDMVY